MLFLERYMFKLASTGQLTGAAVSMISGLDNSKFSYHVYYLPSCLTHYTR